MPCIFFSGPSNFNPVFEAFLEKVEKIGADEKKYQILVILTDGVIHDRDESLATIVKLSDYPCSIIIVGLGDADFKVMEDYFDSDKKKLQDADGNVAFRDIVQFVPYDKAIKDHKLGPTVLQELPRQFVDHALRKGL